MRPSWPFYGYNSAGVPCQRSSRLTRGSIVAIATLGVGGTIIAKRQSSVIGDKWKAYAGLAGLALLLTYVAVDFPKCD